MTGQMAESCQNWNFCQTRCHKPLIPVLRKKSRADFLSLKPAWYTQQTQGQLGLHRKILSQKAKKKVLLDERGGVYL